MTGRLATKNRLPSGQVMGPIAGVPVEEISRLVDHSGTTVTDLVYRHQLRPVIR